MPPLFADRRAARWARANNGGRQGVDATWAALLAQDPTLSTVYVTVDLWLGERMYKLARGPLTTTAGLGGAVHAYAPGLVEEPAVTSGFQIFSQSASARSLSVKVAAAVVDLLAGLPTGATIAGQAEVCWQVDGGDYDRRLVWLRGEITGGITFSPSAGGTVEFTVQDTRQTGAQQLPEIAVDVTRWPLAASSALTMRYPLVINGYPKVPCLRVRDDFGATGLYWLVCSPHNNLSVTASYVNGEATAAGFTPLTETDTVDALGTPVKILNGSSSPGPWEDGDTAYADVGLASGVAALPAIEVLRLLLSRYTAYGTVGLALGLFGRAGARMAGYGAPSILINGSGSDAVDVLDYVESTLLPSYPMVHMLYEGAGLGPVVVDRRAQAGRRGLDFEVTLGAYPLIDRETSYAESARDSRYNAFEVRYGYDSMTQDYVGVVLRDASNDRRCALAQRFDGGRRDLPALDGPVIQSATLAAQILEWLVVHYTVPRYAVTVSAWPAAALLLRPGMTGLFTDPDRSEFTGVRATITSVVAARTGCAITFEIWHPRWT